MDDAARKAVDERIGQALQEVYALARGEHRGGKAWCMRVPVHPDDSDVVLAEALRHARAMIETLAAALREVETEMVRRSSFALLTWQNNWRAACQERDALTARLARVEAALREYGQHKFGCAEMGTSQDPLHAFIIKSPGPCSCGLAALTPDATMEGP